MTLKPLSWNVKGLNTPEKRSSCLSDLWRQCPQIVFLQETYFRADRVPKMYNKHFPTAYHSVSPSSKSKGTSILLSNTLPRQFLDFQTDQEGRYIFLKGKIHSEMFTLANVYLPNINQLTVLESCLSSLDSFSEGTLILGGDFNLTLDPHKDSSMGSVLRPYLKKNKKIQN